MGKLQEFEITFDKNKVVYSPGESISGTVTIKLGQPLQCKAIKVNCNGFCGITNKVNDTAWTVEEQYFNSTVAVADKGTLKQGEHTFPFKFLIPDTAPTSFEGSYGRIVYRVRAFIDTPRFAKDYNTEKAFYLLRLLNLNEVPDVWGTCSSAVTQQFTYMLMKTGTVVLKAETDMKGYTPGQIIKVMANIHNQSGKNTSNMVASLMQRVTYETKRPTHDVRTIAEVEGGVVKAGKELEWKEQIIVPPLPQSSLAGCDLIKIEYYVKVSLKSPDVMLTLPIHIGNVSLDKKLHPSKKVAPPSSAEAEDTPASASTPNTSTSTTTLPPRPAPKPAPRPTPRSRVSSYNSPSAPPAEYHQGAEGGTQTNDGLPNKRHSQLVSPNAFSYAPGLFFSQNHQQHNGPVPAPGELPLSGPTGATAPYPSAIGTSSVPTPLILPPDYGTSAYPQEAPPSYDESCNT
ncbi:arrestin domain-containing protein 1a isoform X1 [Epinephelus fuscoguttatus]|uniref:arrestin domain-containing protein 1a isoform X1 n=1 Tax=Epinephelus fuscoguttatus TaxID=293821 RepID=UPI0020D05A7F|nr:arrestin domain-containing protein 1a isoform X1 [Epinephelus fuscoguttatus]